MPRNQNFVKLCQTLHVILLIKNGGNQVVFE